MKFIAITVACLVVGGSIGAVLGTMHEQFVWFVDQAYIHMSNPYFWR
jgi:hypothetical protein